MSVEEKEISKKITKEDIINFEKILANTEGAEFGDTEGCPLKHNFVTGMYIREIFMPKGKLIVSKIHKVDHPYFILKGIVEVATEEGIKRIEAPYYGITPRGTKRALYIIEDTTWITVHQTFLKDLDKIEKEVIAESFDELEKLESFENNLLEGERKNICHG